MKLVLSFFLLIALFLGSCNKNGIKDPLGHLLSETDAKRDFLLFRNLLQSAHPSLTLYKGAPKTDFLFDSIYHSFSGSLSYRGFYNRLYFLTNEIGCTHTDLFLPDDIYDTLQNRKFFFPYPVLWVENKLLINVSGYDLPEGTQVISINGMLPGRVLNDLAVYNSVDGFHRPSQLNMAAKDFSFQYYLKWGPEEKFDLVIKDTLGNDKQVSLEPITFGEWNKRNENDKYYFDGTDVDYDLTVNNKRGYAKIRLSTFEFDGYQKRKAFEHFCANSFELLKKKKNITRVIIDIRENQGGLLSGAFFLFSYLAKKSFVEYDSVVSKINRVPYSEYLDSDFAMSDTTDLSKELHDEFNNKRNGYFYYADSLIGEWTPDEYRFNGRIFVITNPATASAASAASYFALMVKSAGVGKIVGDETAGGSNSGNGFKTLEYILPVSRIKLLFPFARLAYSFKENKNTGRGVVPDYSVPDTYESFKKNTDRQLDYIIDSLF